MRVLDTRSAVGGWLGRLQRGQTIDIWVPAAADGAVVGTLTVIEPFADGYVTVWGDGDRPGSSSLNASAHEVISNAVVVAPGSDGRIELFAGDGAGQHLALDIVGVFA